jgi:hypothetical protein
MAAFTRQNLRLGKSDETQFEELECRDPLHAGRGFRTYGFGALHLGLTPSVLGKISRRSEILQH